MRWLMNEMLGAGQRSPRLLALTALHLAPLFLACPPVALLYQAQIKDLLLTDVKDTSLVYHAQLSITKKACCNLFNVVYCIQSATGTAITVSCHNLPSACLHIFICQCCRCRQVLASTCQGQPPLGVRMRPCAYCQKQSCSTIASKTAQLVIVVNTAACIAQVLPFHQVS